MIRFSFSLAYFLSLPKWLGEKHQKGTKTYQGLARRLCDVTGLEKVNVRRAYSLTRCIRLLQKECWEGCR